MAQNTLREMSRNVTLTDCFDCRLWDTWTMTLIREILTDSSLPVVSLAYSSSSQHLLASKSDGCLLCFESPQSSKKTTRYPPFINLTLQ